MDIVNDAEAVTGLGGPSTRLPTNEPELATNGTPVGIRSSPPALSTHVVEGPDAEDGSPVGAKSDSDAETVLLPGVDGYSPSKIRKTIKLEDKSNGSGLLDLVDGVDTNKSALNSERSGDSATSHLGKRKRPKHGNNSARHEHARNGNSSGLSSVPTSPGPTARSPIPKAAESESDTSKSPSPRIERLDTAKLLDRNSSPAKDHEGHSADEKEHRRISRRRSSGLEVADKQKQQNPDQASTSYAMARNPTRSTSPQSRTHRRSASSNSAANGPSNKKRKLPAPLRATKDRHSIDEESDDDSSVGESSHPRRSRTRNLATPPTGDSLLSVKMPPHKKRSPFGRTDLADACEDGDITKARRFLQEKPQDLDVADPAGNTPLQCASLNGHVEVVKLLLDAGCNLHCVNNVKDSPLLDAVENGHLEVVKLLLAAGANPKIRNEKGEEPIDKIDKSGDDADAIRQALKTARANAAPTQTVASVQSPHTENYSSRSRRTQSHGRSTKTGDNHLYTSYTVNSLRAASARGDLQTVGQILQVLVTDGFDDPESLVAAARGGHDEVLQILLGFGNADPDPPPLENKDWEHATPMLAAIGSDNIKVIELLLAKIDDDKFDPTKRHHGNTYYEIANQRRGPLWEEEERILKAAFDKYSSGAKTRPSHTSPRGARGHQKKLSDSDQRSVGAKSRSQGGSGSGHGVKGEEKGVPVSGASPVGPKRGPGRPRKEGHESSLMLDHEIGPSATHKEKPHSKRADSDGSKVLSDTEPTKPRRKLISGKDLKGERERKRRASFASLPMAESAIGEAAPRSPPTKANAPRLVSSTSEPDVTEKSLNRARSTKRDDSKDRLSAIRGESPVKRPRNSSTPPSETRESSPGASLDQGLSSKRRRLEGEEKSLHIRAGTRYSPPSDGRRPSGSSGLSHEAGSAQKRSITDSKRSPPPKQTNTSSNLHEMHVPNSSSIQTASTNDSLHSRADKQMLDVPQEDSKPTSDEKIADDEHKASREREQHMEECRQIETAARIKREAEETFERQRAEEERLQLHARQQREKEEAAKREHALQEEAERQEALKVKREQERQDDLKRQEAARKEELRKAEEERRRLYDEQLRLQRGEEERRKAARREEQRAEHRRLQQEREAARLAKLPPLLRWFDGYHQPATREFASEFKIMQGVRYDTIDSEATARPDAREQWLLNTHVALLLGEKDLQLSRCKSLDHFCFLLGNIKLYF